MFSYARIALRNVFRNRRRTLITGSVLISGCVALIIIRGFMEYIYWGVGENVIRSTGHLQVYNTSFLDKEETKPLEYGIEKPAEIQKLLDKAPHVRANEARLEFMGLISNGEKSVAFVGEAVQPERQKRTGMLVQVRTGVDLLASSAENPVILGSDLAKSLNARPGNVLTIMTTTVDGSLNGADVVVAGTYSVGMKEADSRILSIRLDTAQRLLATDRVTKLAIGLDGTESTEEAKRGIEQIFRNNHLRLAIRTWSELSMTYRQIIAVFSTVFAVLSLIIFVLVVLSSSNTMMMAVFERVQEIGTLMALGTSRPRVLGLFLLEGFFFGIIGGAVSVGLAWSISTLLNRSEIQLPPMPMNTDGFPIIIRQLPEVFIGVFLLAVFMMVLGTVVPALRGSRLKIVDALGHI